MNIHMLSKFAAVAVAGALGASVLGGCVAQQTSAVTEAQSENRAYMTQVNQTMETLKDRLTSFSDAVSRGDVVTIAARMPRMPLKMLSSNMLTVAQAWRAR